MTDEPSCDGLCVTAADIGIPGDAVAYPHPGCPLHSPGLTCECGQPDRCLSPTHGQVSMAEARRIRNSQHPRAALSTPPEEEATIISRPCGCRAYDPVHNHHTEAAHTSCCSVGTPCGGCDDCVSAQVTYWERRRAASRTEPTRED